MNSSSRKIGGLRGGDDDLSVDELLVELGVLALLVGGGHKGVALILEPLADAELVLSGSEKLRDLSIARQSVHRSDHQILNDQMRFQGVSRMVGD